LSFGFLSTKLAANSVNIFKSEVKKHANYWC